MKVKSHYQLKSNGLVQPLAFEKAREAVIVLKTVNPLLTPSEKETLEILMDKELMEDLETSLADTQTGRISSLESIL